MSSEALRRATAKYDAENTKRYTVKFNHKTDADILKHLEKVENFAGYVKELIRENIKNAT